MIIERPEEVRRITGSRKWILVYGRRKTGKTFLVRNFVSHDEYFFVRGDRTVISGKDNRSISYEAFLEVLTRALEGRKTIVVDEFQRLEKEFMERLHYMKKEGKLILISSALSASRKLFTLQSPLLGLLAETNIGLISLSDTLKALQNLNLQKKEILELAILLQEPIAIDYFDEKKKAKVTLADIISSSARTIPALTGEIFVEESRELSAVYEGVFRSIATGKSTSGEISSYLFSRKLIPKDDPSIIQQYLNNLASFGIIRKVHVFSKKRFAYSHVSPLARLFYYADEKYNLSERPLSLQELERLAEEMMPRLVEDSLRGFLAMKFGLQEAVFQEKDAEVDICLLRFGKPEIAIEVKWGRVDESDIRKAEGNLDRTGAKRKIIFLPEKKGFKSKAELMDVEDIVE